MLGTSSEALYRALCTTRAAIAASKRTNEEAPSSRRRCGTFNDGTFASEDYAQLVRSDTFRVDPLSLAWREVRASASSPSKDTARAENTGSYQDAARLARAALQMVPSEPKAYYRAAEALRACKQPQQALKAIVKSPRMSPKDGSCWEYALAQLQSRLEEPMVHLLSVS